MKQARFYLVYVVLLLTFLFGVDRLFGWIFPAYPEYLNKRKFSWDSYPSNPRGYFDQRRIADDGRIYFSIDRSGDDPMYRNTTMASDSIRILAVGDSFTIGQGVKLQDTFVRRIEKASNSRKIFGLNAGYGGFGINQVNLRLKEFYDSAQTNLPKLVIYSYVFNDPIVQATEGAHVTPLDMNPTIFANDPTDFGLAYDFINLRTPVIRSMRSPLLDRLGRISKLADFAISITEKRRLSRNTIQFYQDIHDLRKNGPGLSSTLAKIAEMKNLVESHRGEFLVVIFPIFYSLESDYPFENVHRVMTELLDQLNINNIDLQFAYRHHKTESLWVHPVDQHPNELAHQIAADEIVKWIRGNTDLLE